MSNEPQSDMGPSYGDLRDEYDALSEESLDAIIDALSTAENELCDAMNHQRHALQELYERLDAARYIRTKKSR